MLDDGDYSTVEYSVYVEDVAGNAFWGNQQFNLSDPSNTWEWGTGAQIWARNEPLVNGICNALSPTVSAQTWQGLNCTDAGSMFRGVLARAASVWAGGAFAGGVVGCIGSTIGWGVCVTGVATGGFIYGIMYEGYDAGSTCSAGGHGVLHRYGG